MAGIQIFAYFTEDPVSFQKTIICQDWGRAKEMPSASYVRPSVTIFPSVLEKLIWPILIYVIMNTSIKKNAQDLLNIIIYLQLLTLKKTAVIPKAGIKNLRVLWVQHAFLI